MATLAVYGAMAGLLDVSMNACGARLELGYERPIMSSLHAGYSIAGLAGAGIGGLSAWLGLSPLPTFTVTAAALIAGGLLAGPRVVLPPVAAPAGSEPDRPEDPPRRSPQQISAVIWLMGLVALGGQVGEGSAGDWSAVYLHVNLGTSAGVAAVALGVFSVTMAAGGWLVTAWRPGSARCGWSGSAAWWPAWGWRPAWRSTPRPQPSRASRCSAWA